MEGPDERGGASYPAAGCSALTADKSTLLECSLMERATHGWILGRRIAKPGYPFRLGIYMLKAAESPGSRGEDSSLSFAGPAAAAAAAAYRCTPPGGSTSAYLSGGEEADRNAETPRRTNPKQPNPHRMHHKRQTNK